MEKTTKYSEAHVEVEVWGTPGEAGLSITSNRGLAALNNEQAHALFAILAQTEVIEALGMGPVDAAPTVEFPDVLTTAADVLLPWPDGTRVVDNHDDRWEKRGGVWILVGWSWQDTDDLIYTDYPLDKYLPATVTKESN